MAFGNEYCKIVDKHVCPYCEEELLVNPRVFANHMRWCKCNPNYKNILDSTRKKIKETSSNKFKIYTLTCEVCGKEYEVRMTEHKYNSGKYKRTCSDECAKKLTSLHTNKESKNNNIKLSINKKCNEIGTRRLFTRYCKCCGKEFTTNKPFQEVCSRNCSAKIKYLNTISDKLKNITTDYDKIKLMKEVYSKEAKFKFNLSTYKEEFDFSLIQESGWYKASNHGNNLKGISRDHMFAVINGFNELIDPYLISHPANCRLIIHTNNISKGANSILTYDELVKRVEDWNSKYGIYENKISYSVLEAAGIFVKRY